MAIEKRRFENPYYWTVLVKNPGKESERAYVLGTEDGASYFLVGFGEQRAYTRYEYVNDSRIEKWQAEEFTSVNGVSRNE